MSGGVAKTLAPDANLAGRCRRLASVTQSIAQILVAAS